MGETVLGTFDRPVNGSLVFRAQPPALILRTTEAVGNKKFPPKTVLAKLKEGGKVLKASESSVLPWTFKSPTGLVVNPEGKCVQLGEFFQQSGAKSVAKHQGVPPAALNAQGDVLAFHADDAAWKQAVSYTKDLSSVKAVYTVKKRLDPAEVCPTGLAFVVTKQVIVETGTACKLS